LAEPGAFNEAGSSRQ